MEQTSNEKKENQNNGLLVNPILISPNSHYIRETARRITNKTLGVKG